MIATMTASKTVITIVTVKCNNDINNISYKKCSQLYLYRIYTKTAAGMIGKIFIML